MTITEKVNGVALAVHENVATSTELTVQCLSEKVLFQQILNGENTLVLEVGDGKTTTEVDRYLYQKCDKRRPLAGQPMTADDTITVAAMTLEGSFPGDMSLTVELSNNARTMPRCGRTAPTSSAARAGPLHTTPLPTRPPPRERPLTTR